MTTLEKRFAVAGVSTSGRTLTGLAAPFNVETRIGRQRERIAPGAFAAKLADGHDILLLADHDPRRVLARTRNGSLKLEERADGLHFTAELPDTPTAAETRGLAEAGSLGGMSIGFRAVDEAMIDGVRVLKAVALAEISAVASHPAYAGTSVALRTAKPRLARLSRFLETL